MLKQKIEVVVSGDKGALLLDIIGPNQKCLEIS
jgi:hypothetical protein